MENWNDVWTRLSEGQHVVLCGVGPIPEPDPARIRLGWVDCEAHPEPFGSIEEAVHQIDRELGINPWVDIAARRVRSALRRRLLGEDPLDVEAARYEHALRRAAPGGSRPRFVVLLSGLERADRASLERLTLAWAAAHPPTWPLLLHFDSREPSAAARALLQQLERALPPSAFWRGPGTRWQQTSPAALAERLTSLPSDALRVLRAAAIIGDRFEVETVAQLLEIDEVSVLDAVQQALDHGLEVVDRGRGVFRFDAPTAAALRAATLPALARAWHWRLSELFGGLPAPAGTYAQPEKRSVDTTSAGIEGPAPGGVACGQGGVAGTKTSCACEAANDHLDVPSAASTGLEALRPPSWWRELDTEVCAAAAAGATTGHRASWPSPAPAPHQMTDEGRAAEHAEAAGFYDEACERHLAVASAAALAGRHDRALDAAGRALALAEREPEPGPERRLLAARALLVIGQSRWLSRGGEPTSLEQAIEALERARDLLAVDGHPELQAELASTMANVWYDIGTPQALERALIEVTRASHLWLGAKRPLDAARLLNDEAAIWVKLGNYERANQLLSRSREVFGNMSGAHPEAQLELLETEHLIARLMLHAAARPGFDHEALQLGVRHALAAETGYRALADKRHLYRTWETLGRLEIELDLLDAAAARLEGAHAMQLDIGDTIGAARSAGAMSELYFATHDYPRALERLAESVSLNAEKGSGAGLQHNLASLRALESRLPESLTEAARTLGLRIVRSLGSA